MLTPDQVIPFLQHDDPIVRRHAVRYFDKSFDLGSLTAEHYWALIDRFGENDETLSVAADLPELPQTDASLHRLLQTLESKPSDDFKYHYQRGLRDMQFDVLARNAELLLGCGKLLPQLREHLELRLRLRDESPEAAWERLMERGRELADTYAEKLPRGERDALIEAAARGGAAVCERAMAMLADEEAQEDWREIFAVQVLGRAQFEPAIDALVEKFGIDTDLLREETQRALARICTPRVVESVLAFYPGKKWHVRLYAGDPLEDIKHPASEAGLLKLVEVERAIEANPDPTDREAEPLTLNLLTRLTSLCSMAGLQESRREMEANRGNPEAMDLCEGLLATALMCDVTLPEERTWRSRIEEEDRRAAKARARMAGLMASLVKKWRKSGLAPLPSGDVEGPDQDVVTDNDFSLPAVVPSRLDEVRLPIRNITPKVGRNDPCPCGSGKKHKKCCGNK